MAKGTFFTGHPIFNQVLNFIPQSVVSRAVQDLNADRYYKSFKTYEHLVTMLYVIYNQCNSLREATTGLLAWENRIQHLGLKIHPRRSTLSDANKNRNPKVFERIYLALRSRYQQNSPDSHQTKNVRRLHGKDNLYLFDSTTIALFQEILKASGRNRIDGQRKGGIKVHTLLHAASDMPTMIRYSPSADNDVKFLKEVQLPKGSVIVFDKAYMDFKTYNRFTKEKITWVTRLRERVIASTIACLPITADHAQKGILRDEKVQLGHNHHQKATKVIARLVEYRDPASNTIFQFITNNFKLSAVTVANYYKQRWQIEIFFKRIKQNYPLQYFLGDNENAIEIQIWCALIADLLLKVIMRGSSTQLAYSNVVSLVRIHLMTYMELANFLREPEKSLLRKIREQQKQQQKSPYGRTLFDP